MLEGAASAGKVVVLFNALTWCRPCKAMQRPALRIADAYRDSVGSIFHYHNQSQQGLGALCAVSLKIKINHNWDWVRSLGMSV